MNRIRLKDILIFIVFEIIFIGLLVLLPSKAEVINFEHISTVSFIWYLYSLIIVTIIAKYRKVLTVWFKKDGFLRDFLWSLKVFPILFVLVMLIGLIFPVHDKNYVGFNIKNLDFSQKVLFTVIAVLIGPITEELIFRGMVYNFLKNFMKVESSIIITSLFFALFHPLETFPEILLLSILINYFYETRANLVVPITLHSLNNTIALLSLFTLGGG